VLKIVDRLILRELWGPFLFGVGLFSLLIISTVVLQDALKFVTNYSQPPAVFFALVGYAIPQFVVLSIPMGVLLGTLLSVGRLNSDNEIVALRACGISLYRVLAPYFVVGILLSCVTFLGSEIIVPYCNTQALDLEKGVISGKFGLGTRQRFHWPFYNQDTRQLEWVLIAGEVEDSTLRDVVLFYFDARDKYRNFMVEAERAVWSGNSWIFYTMRQVKLHRGGRTSS
jgi:lipopolysaccharide export system permease protein